MLNSQAPYTLQVPQIKNISKDKVHMKHLADGIVKVLEDAVSSKISSNSNESSFPGINEITEEAEYKKRMQIAEKHSCARNLKVLILSRHCRAFEQFVRILKWTYNLVKINFRSCSVNDEVVQQLFGILKVRKLSYLNLNECKQITESGFIGISRIEDASSHLNGSSLMEKITRSLDANNSTNTIANVTKITKLQLNSTGLVDATILAAFHFDDLRSIDVSECHLVTDIGFQYLVVQNRYIERFTAKSCDGLRDEGLNLQRLSHQDIKSCKN